MSGLDAAAAAAQLISLSFQLLGGCISAYKLFHSAQRIGRDGNFLRVKIQLERERLRRWAERVGLAPDIDDAKLRPNETRLNWGAVVEILRLQQELLTSADKLKRRYGFEVAETTAEGDAGKGDGEREEEKGLERVLSLLRPELYGSGGRRNEAAERIAEANGPVKRLKWAAVGREQVIRVVEDLGSLNADLERLLEAVDREWLHSGMAILLRGMLSRSTSLHEVEELQELLRPGRSSSAAVTGEQSLDFVANSKRIRLVLGMDKRSDETQPKLTKQIVSTMPSLKMLKLSRLKSSGVEAGVQLGMYAARLVVVEWRNADDVDPELLGKRMQNLALFLGNAHPSFATLNCMGLLATKSSSSFGLVYELPSLVDPDPGAEHEHRSLSALISSRKRVSLKTRLGIARRMAGAVLQLHTAGWLHKSIRSQNVIFIGSTNSSSGDLIVSSPYLIGYHHSRPDAEGTITKVADVPLDVELYNHPERRGAVKFGFRKCHDLFALGCLLVEIALWESLVDTLSTHTGQDWKALIQRAVDTGQDLQLPSVRELSLTSSFSEEIDHAVGPLYLQAVRCCLSEMGGEDVDGDLSLDRQLKVVECLRQCAV